MSEPLDAVATTAKFPVFALTAAENAIGVVAVRLATKGLAGFELTPGGTPLKVTWTAPENPLAGATDRFAAGLVRPCCTLTALGENEMEKSGCGAGGGGGNVDDARPQPKDASNGPTSRIAVAR